MWGTKMTSKILPLVLALLVPATAAADPNWTVADRARVERALSAYETIPSRGELLKVHPAAHGIMLEIVQFPSSTRALARTRALAVLRHFAGRKTAAALLQAIRKAEHEARQGSPRRPGQEIPLSLAMVDLRQALTSYAVVQGPASLALTRSYLTFPNPDVRASAVAALTASRSPAARALLLARQKVEPSAMVRHQIKRQLRQLEVLKRKKK